MVRLAFIALLLWPGCLRFSIKQRPNEPPVISAPTALVVDTGSPVAIDATATTDPDGDPLSFSWTVLEGQNDPVTLAGATEPIVSFAAPDRGQRVFLKLVVSDGAAQSEAFVRVRVNSRPVVSTSALQSGRAPFSIEAAASDPDGDPIVGYAWQIVAPPVGAEACMQTSTSCLSGQGSRVATLDGPPGTYRLALVVSDGDRQSEPYELVVELAEKNRAPVLGFASNELLVTEGTALPFDASAAFDPDGTQLTITWTRTSGASLFATSLTGSQPSAQAPAYASLLDGNSATYVVAASDGELTTTATLTVFVLPGSGYVVVSSETNADDAALPVCGSPTQPCRTIARALQLVDPDANNVGDGRDILLTGGLFTSSTSSPSGLVWRAGTSVIGSRDPRTFAPGARSVWQHKNQGCHNPVVGLRLGLEVSADVRFERFDFNYAPEGCINRNTAFDCDRCSARLYDVVINASIPRANPYASYARALFVRGGGASPRVERSRLSAGSGDWANVALEAWTGTSTTLVDTRLEIGSASVAGANAGDTAAAGENTCLHLEGGAVTATGVLCLVQGAAPTGTTAGVVSNGGTLSFTNGVLSVNAGEQAHGVLVLGSGGATTLMHATVSGADYNSGSGAALTSALPVSVMNSLLQGFPVGVALTSPGALSSRFFGNVSSGLTTFANCNGTPVLTLNAPASSPCNQTGTAWSGNQSGTCGFVSSATGDYRLNASAAATCVNAALDDSPIGAAPTLDFEGDVRSAGMRDVGADELVLPAAP